MKTCFKCFFPKPLSDFYKHPGTSDGRLGKCKECCKKFAKQHRRNPVVKIKIKEYKKGYEQRPEVKKRHKDYEKQHSELGQARRKRWAEKNPEKMRVKRLTDSAIRSGKLIKQPCAECGKTKVEAHHRDYSKPFDVIWLCKKHHWEADEIRRASESS